MVFSLSHKVEEKAGGGNLWHVELEKEHLVLEPEKDTSVSLKVVRNQIKSCVKVGDPVKPGFTCVFFSIHLMMIDPDV